jgi:hypothetical protein
LVAAYAAETGLLVSAFEARTCCSLATSAVTGMPPTSAATRPAAAEFRSTTAIARAPRVLARRQASAPSPLPPPVMATMRPASLMTPPSCG